ncbi:ferredoxin reductase family protein [Microbacterium hominis]|uniref:Ferric reductase-like transmembrane domain-containing protein n=1 Tax=Microbacterium hominis TaxID=162426 RepID=A0A7D4TG62_9MICO|nr:ferric reductase-like transmembrane domain-containing protein [Microbacterium hominis]QKJ19081.1 ferric reductase-like transmembrane domain-containing protein [Microbacterium hominis]
MASLAVRSRPSVGADPAAPSVGTPDRRGASRARWNLAAAAIIWLTSLFVVSLWVAGGGISSFLASDAETFNTLGRLTGLVSANLLLYQVLLMARVPVFERGFGRDAITRMHRLVGFWSFWLLVAHIALQTAGYAAQADLSPLVQLWRFVWEYPGMLLAAAGTLLLVMVVVTSIRRARRRRRYESWHLLHLYAYLGVGLAVPHMLWTGADFVGSPPAATYWWMLWAAAAASVLVFRIGVPLWRSWRHDIRVVSVAADGARGVTVRMRGRGLHRLRARAGQFFVWRFMAGPGWTRGHPLSLAAAPVGGEFVVAARLAGDGTRRLAELRPGTRVLVEGPYGHLTGEARTGTKMLMLGAGAGIAPLVALLEAEPYAPGDAVLITRDHDALDAMRVGEIQRLVRERGLRHHTVNGSRGARGPSWLPATHAEWSGPELIRHVAPDLDLYDVFVCGPAPWMDAVRADLRSAGVAASRIHVEAFSI